LPSGTGFAWQRRSDCFHRAAKLFHVEQLRHLSQVFGGFAKNIGFFWTCFGPVLDWDWLWMRFDRLHSSRITGLRNLLQICCG
jgi:hypothetical protein